MKNRFEIFIYVTEQMKSNRYFVFVGFLSAKYIDNMSVKYSSNLAVKYISFVIDWTAAESRHFDRNSKSIINLERPNASINSLDHSSCRYFKAIIISTARTSLSNCIK